MRSTPEPPSAPVRAAATGLGGEAGAGAGESGVVLCGDRAGLGSGGVVVGVGAVGVRPAAADCRVGVAGDPGVAVGRAAGCDGEAARAAVLEVHGRAAARVVGLGRAGEGEAGGRGRRGGVELDDLAADAADVADVVLGDPLDRVGAEVGDVEAGGGCVDLGAVGDDVAAVDRRGRAVGGVDDPLHAGATGIGAAYRDGDRRAGVPAGRAGDGVAGDRAGRRARVGLGG